MKKYLIAAGLVVLMGGGCSAVSDDASEKDAPSEQVSKKAEKKTTKNTSKLDVPADSELLPRDGEWNLVTIKNFGTSYSVEIHPWWHWDASSAYLKDNGAAFANSKDALLAAAPTSEDFRMRINVKGGKVQNATSLDEFVASGTIGNCSVYRGDINGFDTCIGISEGGSLGGVALKNDGAYEWKATFGSNEREDSVGYISHILESFTEL